MDVTFKLGCWFVLSSDQLVRQANDFGVLYPGSFPKVIDSLCVNWLYFPPVAFFVAFVHLFYKQAKWNNKKYYLPADVANHQNILKQNGLIFLVMRS